ncbi:hypothetical protein PENTCL1PPCAC_19800, partial [Pristionchus entomophagus]
FFCRMTAILHSVGIKLNDGWDLQWSPHERERREQQSRTLVAVQSMAEALGALGDIIMIQQDCLEGVQKELITEGEREEEKMEQTIGRLEETEHTLFEGRPGPSVKKQVKEEPAEEAPPIFPYACALITSTRALVTPSVPRGTWSTEVRNDRSWGTVACLPSTSGPRRDPPKTTGSLLGPIAVNQNDRPPVGGGRMDTNLGRRIRAQCCY